MSWWTDFRDGFEALASVALNFFYPGSGMLSSQVVSEGAQNFLSPGGKTGWFGPGLMMASGIAGAGTGQMENYGSTLNYLSGAGSAAPSGISGIGTLGADPNTIQAAKDMVAMGATPETAAAQVGLTPAQAQAAGITQGAAPVFDIDPTAGGGYSTATGPGMTGTATLGGMSAAAPGATQTPAGSVPFQTAMNTVSQGVGAMPWLSPAGVSNILGGISGLLQSRKTPNMQEMMNQADPFNQYRAGYGERLQRLMNDPSLITKEPGYEAGLEAVRRSMAAQGYTGSGNSLAAISRYGGDFFNRTADRYATLAGAGVSPAVGAQMGLQSQQLRNQTQNNAIAQLLGYTGTMAGNRWPWQSPPAQQQQNPLYYSRDQDMQRLRNEAGAY